LEFVLTGNDPQIILPIFKIPRIPVMLDIEFTSSHPGKIQVYYQTSRSKIFSEANSINQLYEVGRNLISLIIYEYDIWGRFRLDFDENEGVLQIHSIICKK